MKIAYWIYLMLVSFFLYMGIGSLTANVTAWTGWFIVAWSPWLLVPGIIIYGLAILGGAFSINSPGLVNDVEERTNGRITPEKMRENITNVQNFAVLYMIPPFVLLTAGAAFAVSPYVASIYGYLMIAYAIGHLMSIAGIRRYNFEKDMVEWK